MLKLQRICCLTTAAISMSLTWCEGLANAQASKPTLLGATVTFAVATGDDIVADIQNLSNTCSVPINLEVVHKYGQGTSLVIPGFVLPLGKYRLDQILKRLAAASRKFSWQTDGQSVNVTISLAVGVENPFNDRFKADMSESGSPAAWINDLDAKDQSAGLEFQYSVEGANQQQPGAGAPVTVDVTAGSTMREALNAISEKSSLHWTAFVQDVCPVTISGLVDGKLVTISRPNEMVGRTRVWLDTVDSHVVAPT